MFTVYDKKTRQEVKALRVRDDENGYPQFLVEIGNEWVYRSAKHYTTNVVTFKEPLPKEITDAISCSHNYKAICKNNFQPPYFNDETLYRCIECGHEYWQ